MSARAAFACGRQTWAGLQTAAGVGRGWKAWLLGGPGFTFKWRATCLCSVAHAQAAQMLGFRMQFVSVHVRLPSAVHRTLAGIGLGCM